MRGFETFYAASYPRTVALAYLALGRWAEAEDVAVEAYARIAADWGQRPEREDPSRRVRVVTLGLALDRRARFARRLRLLRRPTDVRSPLDRAGSTAAHLADALGGLPVLDRCALALHYAADLSVEQVADELALSHAAARRRIARGRRHLVEVLGSAGGAAWEQLDLGRG